MTHPRFSVPCPVGALSMMPCPPSVDAPAIFADLRDAGVTHVLSMLAQDEAAALGMADEVELCAAQGITFLAHPIEDYGLPQMNAFADLVQKITELLREDAHVTVHCKAGIGRSGTVASCVLVALGADPATAQNQVSEARGVAVPDTAEQAAFIGSFATALRAVG